MKPAPVLDGQAGFDLQADGQAKVLAATGEDWIAAAWAFIEARARAGVRFTTDDLRSAVGDPPRVNALGAITTRAEKQGLIHLVGYVPSIRVSRRGGRIAVWTGAAR